MSLLRFQAEETLTNSIRGFWFDADLQNRTGSMFPVKSSAISRDIVTNYAVKSVL